MGNITKAEIYFVNARSMEKIRRGMGDYAMGGYVPPPPKSDNVPVIFSRGEYWLPPGTITKLADKLKMHPSDVREVLVGLSSFAAAKESEVSPMKDFGIGSPVIYIDTLGRERPALVTNMFGPLESNPSINVVYVNLDEDQTDSYGRKTERASSVVHHSHQYAHGNKWKPVGE